jgi:hypothetical protein
MYWPSDFFLLELDIAPTGLRVRSSLLNSRNTKSQCRRKMRSFGATLSIPFRRERFPRDLGVGPTASAGSRAQAVRLTLAVVFVAMAATGKNFDRITLGFLILALGLRVDDAIIAIEMMAVKMEEGGLLRQRQQALT